MSSKQTTPEAPLRNHHDWRRFVAKAAADVVDAADVVVDVAAGKAAADDVGGVAAYNAVFAAGASTTAKVFQAILEGRRSWQMVAKWSKDH